MRRVSKTNRYRASDGTLYTSAEVDRRIRQACYEVMQEQALFRKGNYCVECGKNSSAEPVDPAHIKSVRWCKNNGCVELAWDKKNIRPLCRTCHNKYDKLNLQFNSPGTPNGFG